MKQSTNAILLYTTINNIWSPTLPKEAPLAVFPFDLFARPLARDWPAAHW